MIKHVSVVLFALQFVFSGLALLQSQTNMVFEEVDGLVAVEAEHFSKQKKTDKRMWYLCDKNTSPRDNEGNFSSIASGNAYMEILPDTRRTHSDLLIHGDNFSNTPGTMAIIEYQVYFNNPGRYYVWARAYSTGPEDNGMHVGINGTWPSSGQRLQWCQGKNSWRWESAQRTNEVHCGVPGQIYLDVPSAGIHTIAFSLREDGFRFDKWILTKDPDFERPEDAGPVERIFTGTAKTNPVTGSYYFSAILDFEDITSGVVPYYKDTVRKALAINAARKWKRDEFASATTTFYGNENTYDIQLTTLAEFDGECTYRVLVNDKVIGTFINTSVHVDDDYKPINAVFRNIKLSANDKITVESNTHTNRLIPEGDGTAWARGRWKELACIPSCERSIVRAFPGRVAWSGDGNQHDTDDWLASPWALALFRAAGLQRKVVYFGYNNHIWDTRNEYEAIHDKNIRGTLEKWGGYNEAILFNEIANTDAAIDKLVEEINKSTESNPLWLAAAGPVETFGRAIEKSDPSALRFVTILSHSTWNTDHATKEHNSKYSLDYLKMMGVHYKKIKDQNNQDGTPAWTAQGLKRKTEYFEFLKDYRDERMQWLWTCRKMPEYETPNYQKGFYDYSDAGMAWWLITGANNGGDEEATPQKTFDLLKGFINAN
jgi:hypothetical protein